jgi:two-component system response regulator RpfG
MIIDDLLTSRLLLAELVRQIDGRLNIVLFDAADKALDYASRHRVDLVLTDYKMPDMDGIQVIRRLRAIEHYVDVPVVVITVVEDKSIRYQALDAGATDFLTKPLDEYETRVRCANLLELRRHKMVLSDRARVLKHQVDEAVAEIHSRELETLSKLAKAGEYHDSVTGNHLTRMGRYSGLIARNMDLDADSVHVIEVAAPMHDIGKIGIPHSILLKRERLSDEERKVMMTHPGIGHDILKGSPSKYLNVGAMIALGHHERFDGTGYPSGLAGRDIPVPARIVAVADVFDALSTQRSYKEAWSVADSIAYLQGAKGTQFDPVCVDAFCRDVGEVQAIVTELADS